MKTEEVVFLAFMGILCFCSCIYTSFCKNKPDQENLETNERQKNNKNKCKSIKINDK